MTEIYESQPPFFNGERTYGLNDLNNQLGRCTTLLDMMESAAQTPELRQQRQTLLGQRGILLEKIDAATLALARSHNTAK